MQLEFAQRLVDTAQSIDVELELYENYSGRGMYGKSTTAVQFDSLSDLMTVIYHLGVQDGENGEDSKEAPSSWKVDSLGRSEIVY